MFVNTTAAALLSFCASYFQCTFATIIHDGLSEVLQYLEAKLHQTIVVETRRLARLIVSHILSMNVFIAGTKETVSFCTMLLTLFAPKFVSATARRLGEPMTEIIPVSEDPCTVAVEIASSQSLPPFLKSRVFHYHRFQTERLFNSHMPRDVRQYICSRTYSMLL